MPTNFIIGQLLMLFASKKIKHQEHQFWTKPFVLSLAYSALVFVPVTAYYFYAHMGWSTVYLRDEALIPGYAGPIIFLLYFIGMFIGASSAQALIQNDQPKMVRFTLAFGILWFVGTVLLTRDEYAHIGTYAQFHAGLAQSIFSNKAFMTELNIMGFVLAAPAIALAYYFRKLR